MVFFCLWTSLSLDMMTETAEMKPAHAAEQGRTGPTSSQSKGTRARYSWAGRSLELPQLCASCYLRYQLFLRTKVVSFLSTFYMPSDTIHTQVTYKKHKLHKTIPLLLYAMYFCFFFFHSILALKICFLKAP